MTRQPIALAVALLITAAAPFPVGACDFVAVHSSADLVPDEQRTALSGTVVGYVDTEDDPLRADATGQASRDNRDAPSLGVTSPGFASGRRGLLVDVDTGVAAPERMRWYFGALVPGTDCDFQPSEEYLRDRFPLGRRVTVVAAIRPAAAGGLRWIADAYAGRGQIGGVPVDRLPPPGRFAFAAYTRKTYAIFREIERRHTAANPALTRAEDWLTRDRWSYEDFEWYRTLVYVRAASASEREVILRAVARALPFSGEKPGYTRTHYMDVVDWVGVSPAARQRLFDAFPGRRE